jgi:hypothetical protein
MIRREWLRYYDTLPERTSSTIISIEKPCASVIASVQLSRHDARS